MFLMSLSRSSIRGPGRKEAGFTLLEVLVTVVIISIGLLGLAGMQILGLRYVKSSYARTQAAIVAYDIIDRMRANPAAVDIGNYDNVDSDAPPSDPNCILNGCTSAQLAAYDQRDWSGNFSDLKGVGGLITLPAGRGQVIRNGNVFSITVSWQELNHAGELKTDDLVVNVRL